MENVLDSAAEQFPQPGRTDSLRRLTRTEYVNAVRDLLAIEINAADLLPADESAHGFDNVTVGELSPMLLGRYISAAQQISRLAMGSSQRGPIGTTYRLPADLSQESHVVGLPLGTRGGTLIEHYFPQSGQYEIQLRLARDRDEHIEGLIEPHDLDVLLDRSLQHRFTIEPAEKKKSRELEDHSQVDAHLRITIAVTAGTHQLGVTFLQKSASLAEIKRQPFDTNFNRHRHPRRTPALFEVSLLGPIKSNGTSSTPSRLRLLAERPTQASEATATAEQTLRRLIRLAYRRPAEDADLQMPLQFFQQKFDDTTGELAARYEAGIEAAVASVLVNPHFLFKAEQTPAATKPGEVFAVSDFELASRLSFFLWSSLPDNELLTAAETGELRQPELLAKQVERMLHDERSQSLINSFAAQWLYLKNLESFRPDMRLFPDFDENLRQAMRTETEMHFARVMRDDRSVLDLIRTDNTFLNERLAKHYGVPGVFGSHFRQVQLPADSLRGGLLRQGSILAVTSYATRTSPTVRGNWILENLLGIPAPPPPPNIPSLGDKTAAEATTVRERLAEHRANPTCASCHDLMDPIGLAMENFDAVGRWRTLEAGEPIDASGNLPDGSTIAGVDELEAGILARPEMFVGTLTEKLLTFALGRGVESNDAPAVRKIVRNAAENNYCFSSLITGIAQSVPFQNRVAEDASRTTGLSE